MTDTELAAVLAATALAAAGCTVLPGVAVNLVGAWRRVRGRPTEQAPLLGPLFADELTRLARRGLQPWLRGGYAAVLLVGLLVTYLNEFRDVNPLTLLAGGAELPLDRTSAFAGSFFRTFLFVQLAALTLLTPVFAAGAVTEETERGTLDYLRTTFLSNRELVVGKLAARLVFVLGVAAAGLPVLTLTLLFGGVAPEQIVCGFAAAFASTLSLGAYSFYAATRRRTLKDALFAAYGLAVGLLVACGCGGACLHPFAALSPIAFTLIMLDGDPTTASALPIGTVVFVAVHGLFAVLFTVLAMGAIRTAGGPVRVQPAFDPPRYDGPNGKRWELSEVDGERIDRSLDRTVIEIRRAFRVPRVGADDPLMWKEDYFGGSTPVLEANPGVAKVMAWGLVAVFVVSVGLALFVGTVELLAAGKSAAPVVNPALRVVAAVAAVVLAPLAGLRAAGTVGRERQRQTLDALLTLPIDRADILAAKWRAAVRWAKPWVYAAGCVLLFAGLTGSVDPFGGLSGVLLLAAYLPFCVSFGLYLSVRCRTTARAAAWYLAAVIAATVGPLLLAGLARAAIAATVGSGFAAGLAERLFESVSVPAAVWQAFHTWMDDDWPRFAAAVLAAGVYAVAGQVYWRAARRRFEDEGRE